ncbi:MAG: CoA-binding protein [Clostridia bacterium]|nr:MAG: CoA-binding protein [Clostridia bacterium]
MGDLQGFFAPRAVAVVGASNTPGKIGYAVMKNIIESKFPGVIYPVNPGQERVFDLPAYPEVGDLPEVPEMVVVVVPAARVLQVARACGEKGSRFLVVISAGFKEIGRADLERDLVDICRQHQMRLLGPNCLGFMDTHTPINASFAVRSPLPGKIAFFSQSGALCLAILDWSLEEGLGFSKFVSFGNKAGLNESDFMAEALADEGTKVILCYLEDVADGVYFLRVARENAGRKPIIILKSGRSQAGARAASSHTGALAGSDRAYDTAFRQAGVLRADTIDELFDLARAFITQPPARGRRLAIVTNSGGPGIIATDAAETYGMEMAGFERETSESLRHALPEEASVYNPVDILGDAAGDRYDLALRQVLADPHVDNCLVLLTPTATVNMSEIAAAILRNRRAHPEKVATASFIGGESVAAGVRALEAGGVPCYSTPERAIAAMSGLASVRETQARLAGGEESIYGSVNREAVSAVLAGVREQGRVVLLGSEASEITAAYGIPTARSYLATTVEAAVEIAASVGYPVVLKVASPRIVHKSDVGGVRANLADPEAVRQAFFRILEDVQRYLPGAEVLGVEVQAMADPGLELIVGVNRDVQFGPLLMFGLGGIYVNLLEDVSFRLADGLRLRDIKEMIAETRAYRLLRGYRGQPPADMAALEEAIGRVAMLVRDFPAISEMDINPLLAYPQGVMAIDVKISIG